MVLGRKNIDTTMEKNNRIERIAADIGGTFTDIALITDSGNIYTGCNIENASYPATVCGEDVAILKAISEGETKIDTIAVACIDAKSETAIFPCGISRQRMSEFNTEYVIVVNDNDFQKYKFEEVLPFDFKF